MIWSALDLDRSARVAAGEEGPLESVVSHRGHLRENSHPEKERKQTQSILHYITLHYITPLSHLLFEPQKQQIVIFRPHVMGEENHSLLFSAHM